MSDLSKIYDAITAKQKQYTDLVNYMSGQQPTTYLTARLRDIFKNVDARFTANWCSVVVNAVDERINLKGFESKSKPVETLLHNAWERNSTSLEASDIHSDALVMGEAYAIAWPDADGKAEVFYNDARMVHALYAADNPRKITVAGKLWQGDDGKAKMTLYYADRLEYYTSTEKYENVTSAAAFVLDTSVEPDGKATNTYGQVPVFHFKINRHCESDLANVIPLQNGINKLLADMMVAAEYGAFSQRWVISQGDTSDLKNAPNEVWSIPAGDGQGQASSVGQFQPTDLKSYLDAIDRLSMTIGVITRTPKHYFFTQGGDPSGEALIALEAPLNKKAQDRIDRFFPVWQQIGVFICKIEGQAVAAADITPQFEKPSTIQPRTNAEIIKLNTDAGIPLDTALTVAGWTDDEISSMNAIKDKETEKSQMGLASALMAAERNMKSNQMPQQTTQAPQGMKNGAQL